MAHNPFDYYILTGCLTPVEQTPIEKAQYRILLEIQDCQRKFGSNEYENIRTANIQYCQEVLALFERMVEAGYFDEERMTLPELDDINWDITAATADNITVKKEVEDLTQDIIGDI